MMEKNKPSGSESPVEEIVEEATTTDDREAEISRRLAALGDVILEEKEAESSDLCQEVLVDEEVETVKEEPIAVAPEKPKEEMKKPETPVSLPVPPAQTISAKANNKSALLARIMAAQERAKQAQMKQAQHTPSSMQAETQKMMEALNGLTDKKLQPPPSIAAPPAPPLIQKSKSDQPPPPSFDIFEKQMLAATPRAHTATAPAAPPMAMAPPPPAFESIAPHIFTVPPVPVMTASDADLLGHLAGVTSMAPPVSAPSFDQVMQQNLMAAPPAAPTFEATDFELDENGMKLSPAERQKMIEEQRAIMEHIEREARNQKASEAAVKADVFASRMTGNPGANAMVSSMTTEAKTNVDGFSAGEIEEQRKILEQIEKEARKGVVQGESSNPVNIEIGGGQNLQLHGQEKTQEAIKKGTAQLVLCLNCNNWMQVVESATLMFCPICSVVTPVVRQDQIMSKAEILQMEEDRKLAEMLQAEEEAGAGVSDFPGNRRAATSRASAVSSSNDKSWWDTISEGLGLDSLVGVGVSAEEPIAAGANAAAEYRAPGNMSSSQRMLHSAVTGEEGGEEHMGLLGSEGGSGGRPSARVAQSQPLFSCVVDSISSSANAASTYIMGEDDEEVNGVDTTSFLSVPNVGRDKNEGSGNYFALPPNE